MYTERCSTREVSSSSQPHSAAYPRRAILAAHPRAPRVLPPRYVAPSVPELQPEAPAQRRYHAAEARHAVEAKLREELFEQLKSENAFLKVTADKQAEKIEKMEKQTEKMEAEKIEKTEKQTEKMEKMAETIATLRSKLGHLQARLRAQPRPEMMLPEMRGGGPSRESPVRSLFQNSPRRSAERSRSEQDEGSPLSDLDLSAFEPEDLFAALARSLTN